MHATPSIPRDCIVPQRTHPRAVGWFGTTAVAMGGINQSLFLIGALFVGQGSIPGQGSAAVPLLAAGLLLAWAATPGWTELILMYPNRVGGIAATCAEAFRPYSAVLAKPDGCLLLVGLGADLRAHSLAVGVSDQPMVFSLVPDTASGDMPRSALHRRQSVWSEVGDALVNRTYPDK
jgi:hypothetical protein